MTLTFPEQPASIGREHEQDNAVEPAAHVAALSRLAVEQIIGGKLVTWYRAADPGYPPNFSRDGLINAQLAGDTRMLADQVRFSASFQGQRENPETGEEEGKIHHEINLVNEERLSGSVRGGSTMYNACDTTALFLSSIARLHESGEQAVTNEYRENIEKALRYIKRHVGLDGLFREFPPWGTDDSRHPFDLRVTMWKDSRLNTKDREEPDYPIVYSQVHFQNAAALRDIGNILGDEEGRGLVAYADAMTEAGIEALWRNDHFVSSVDRKGDIDAPSSDSLHALLYIPPKMLPLGYADKVQAYMEQLETLAGYRTGLPAHDGDEYHTRYIWVHEQSLLHAAATLHGLSRAQQITERIRGYYNGVYPELVDPQNDYLPAGNCLQLWAIGAQVYFSQPEQSKLLPVHLALTA